MESEQDWGIGCSSLEKLESDDTLGSGKSNFMDEGSDGGYEELSSLEPKEIGELLNEKDTYKGAGLAGQLQKRFLHLLI